MTFTKATSAATTTSFSATTSPGSFADGASAREVVVGAQETMNVLDEEQTAKLNAARANSSPRYFGDALRKRRGVQALEACPSVLPYLILVSGWSSWLCDIRYVYSHLSRGTKAY